VLAIVFFTVLLMGFGILQPTTTIQAVPDCVLPADAQTASREDACDVPIVQSGPDAGAVCEEGTPNCALPPPSPAVEAGFEPGDTIVALDGTPVSQETGPAGWQRVQDAIRGTVEQPLRVTVERDGEERDLTVTPIQNLVYTSPDAEEPSEVGYVGISPLQDYVRQPITAVPGYLGDVFVRSVQRLVEIPERIPQLFRAAFLGEERDPQGPIGVVGVSRLSGEVFALEDVETTGKIAFLLSLLAGVNLVLFLFNLLPIYPLDGGHVAGALYEKARSTVARMRGRPDPGPFDIARLMPVAYAVAGLFLALSALLLVADVVNPIRIGG
jgi:membrane-associated protease RseP (regulator of RpoE activity)